MPLKSAVLDLLEEASDLVWAVGAANTAVRRGAGWYGENTDVAGIIAALAGVGAPAQPTLILGAGGTARAAVAACAQLGITEVTIAARRPAAADALAEVGSALGLAVATQQWPTEQLPAASELPVVISTVPAIATYGLLDLMPERAGWLLDVTYEPWPSRLAAAWTAAGGIAAGGAEMLVAQAAAQVELFTGQRPDVAAMRAALLAELAVRATA